MRSREFPSAPLERVAKSACKKRMSREAARMMRNYVLSDAQDRAKEIAELVRHAGRKTVLREDVEFVTKRHLPI